MEPERRLAAILFTDIVGSTALMAESEQAGLRAKRRHRELVANVAALGQLRRVDEARAALGSLPFDPTRRVAMARLALSHAEADLLARLLAGLGAAGLEL